MKIERKIDMKAKIVMILMAVALYALPTMAQNNMDFRSTSTMRGSGTYVAPVTAVGATSAASTYSPAQAPTGPRRAFDNPGEVGQGGSPIGDAVLPLAVMAVAFAGVVYYRHRKRSALND